MANITVNPISRLSRIPSGRTYSDVAAKYAASFAAALDKQEQNEIQSNFDSFKLGNLTFDAFKKYLTDKIATAPIGTTNNANWSNILVQATAFNTTNINNMAAQKADSLRSELLNKFTGQVTTKDQLGIVRQIIGQIPKESKVYNDLVQEEMKLKNQMANENKLLGGKATAANFDKAFAILQQQNNKIIADYQAGAISGYEADKQLYQNGLTMSKLADKAMAAGATVSDAKIKDIVDTTVFVKQQLAQREVGQVFDVLGKDDKLHPVTHDILLADQNKVTPDYVGKRFVPKTSPDGSVTLMDTTTGAQVGESTGYANINEAKLAAENLRSTQDPKSPLIPNTTSITTITPDTNQSSPTFGRLVPQKYTVEANGSFTSPTGESTFAPAPDFGTRFKATVNKTLNDFMSAGNTILNKFINPDQTLNLENLQKSYQKPLTPGLEGPIMNPQILPEPTPSPTPAPTPQPIGKPTVDITKDVFGRARPLAQKAPVPFQNNLPLSQATQSGPMVNPLASFTPTTFNPLQPFVGTGPEKLFSNFGGPSLSPTTGSSATPTPSTNQQPNLFERIKQFGANAIGAVKKTFGF